MGELIETMRDREDISPQQFARILLTFEGVIGKSFAVDGSRMTGSEVRRRYLICEKWLRTLRHEGWSITRILDLMPRALRTELDGGTFDPGEERRVWMP
jgi:hypothetical protein